MSCSSEVAVTSTEHPSFVSHRGLSVQTIVLSGLSELFLHCLYDSIPMETNTEQTILYHKCFRARAHTCRALPMCQRRFMSVSDICAAAAVVQRFLHACLSRFFDRRLHIFFLPCFSVWVRNPASDAARVHSAITLFSLMTTVTCAGWASLQPTLSLPSRSLCGVSVRSVPVMKELQAAEASNERSGECPESAQSTLRVEGSVCVLARWSWT